MAKIESLCVFGDSTAWGAWDMEKGGWVNRLWLYAGEKTDGDCEIYNLSISGGRTDTILARFEAEARARRADGLIFQSGGNDACLHGENGPNEIPIEDFRANVQAIISRAKGITENVIFIGFKNVDESRTRPVSWRDFHYLNSEIERYKDAMAEICRANNVPFLDIFGLLEEGDFEDGLHPNARGHGKIFEKTRDFLEEQKWL